MLDCLLYYLAEQLDLPNLILQQVNTNLFHDDQEDRASELIFFAQQL